MARALVLVLVTTMKWRQSGRLVSGKDIGTGRCDSNVKEKEDDI